ncbi:MAG: DNA repair protein RadC [Saprospirales bacterium]|nr:MAG: DNA repair protein RadC [Saprospirales bacterium]
MDKNGSINGIKSWAEEDRPREKMIKSGVRNLTNAELIAILLGSGTRSVSAVDLAKEILSGCDNNLNSLGRMKPGDLTEYRGIGIAKAVVVSAALELGRRRRTADLDSTPKVSCSSDAAALLAPLLADLDVEEFWVLCLNRANRVVKKEKISSGGISGVFVDPRLVLLPAIKSRSSNIILCHNHPSGNLQPSAQDISVTKKISEACKFLDINLLDHIIVSQAGYYSFADSRGI